MTSGSGGGFVSLNNSLSVTQFYGGAGHAGTGRVIGGTQDNGSLLYGPAAGPNAWSMYFGGDGGFAAIDPTDANYLYGEYVYLRMHRSTNGGQSSDWIYGFNPATGACKAPPYVLADTCPNVNALFIAPFILDSNDSDRLYAGARSLWRSPDINAPNTNTTGPQWYSIKPAIAAAGNISAIAVAPFNPNIIWVGYAGGHVYKTTDGLNSSPTWTTVDDNSSVNPLPNRYITRIAIDPTNPNIVYVTEGGFSPDNIWRTTNGGTNWSDRTGSGGTGLPDVPVRSLLIKPDNPTWIYAGTEVGIFASIDAGATWTLPHDGPSNVSVDELFWMGTKLVAATHGRGMFTTDVSGGPSCDAIAPGVVDFSNAGGTGTVDVSGVTDCVATVTENEPWLTLQTSASITGSGRVVFRVAPTSGPARTGQLLVGGRVVQIRQTAAPPVLGDINGNGTADLFWQHTNGALAAWLMNGSTLSSGQPLGPGSLADVSWRIAAQGDFDGDGSRDVVFQHANGSLAAWLMSGTVQLAGTALTPGQVADTMWRVRCAADMDRDGHMDLIWQHEGDGRIAVWLMNRLTLRDGQLLSPGQVSDTSWRIVGAADLNLDGHADLLWQHETQGWIAAWLMNGTSQMSGQSLGPGQVADTNWKLRANGDFNGDGRPDLIWHHRTTGEVAVWLMNGLARTAGLLLSPGQVPDTGWQVVGSK